MRKNNWTKNPLIASALRLILLVGMLFVGLFFGFGLGWFQEESIFNAIGTLFLIMVIYILGFLFGVAAESIRRRDEK